MKILDMVRAAKASIKSRSSVPIFTARLGRLRLEGRAPAPTVLIADWISWVAYLNKLRSDNKLDRKSYATLSRRDNPVACGLYDVIEAPVNGPKAKDWTVIPILNKERTDIKEIVIASPVNPNNIMGPLMEVARWRQNGGNWKLEGNIESEKDPHKTFTNYGLSVAHHKQESDGYDGE